MWRTLIIIITFFIGCKENKTKDSTEKIIQVQDCIDHSEKEDIVNSIFKNSYVSKHMDTRVKNSILPLKILDSDFFNGIDILEFRGKEIVIVDSMDITDDTFRLKFNKVDCKNKTLSFLLLYPIEGKWYAEGKVNYLENKWETEIVSGGIAD